MKIGLFTDSLQDLSFPEAVNWVADHGIEAVELGTGNFSNAPHCNLEVLLTDAESRAKLLGELKARGLILSALNCNGNVLDPDPARRSKAQQKKCQSLSGYCGGLAKYCFPCCFSLTQSFSHIWAWRRLSR